MTVSDERPVEAAAEPAAGNTSLIKLACELGPLVVFFVANSRWDIFVGTAAFMVAMVASVVASKTVFGRVPPMALVTAVFVLVFGGLTLVLADDTFIKLKPTLVNLLFASLLLGGLAFGKLFIKVVFEEAFRLTDEGWRILTVRWGVFFVFLAIVNEVVWRNFSNDFWISFKIWGVMPMTLVFGAFQLPVIQRHNLEPEAVEEA